MITGNEPAYATDHVITDSFGNVEGIEEKRWSGLTIRQHFAAMAMQGIMADQFIEPNVDGVKYAAELAVTAADALIAALNNSNKQP